MEYKKLDPNNSEPSAQPPEQPQPQPPVEQPAQPYTQPSQPPVQPQPSVEPATQPFAQPPVQSFAAPVALSSTPNNSKKFIIIGAIVAGVIVLALIAWVIFSMLFSVSKEDYRQAAKVSNDTVSLASTSYTDVLKISYISSYSTETQTKNDIASAKESLAAYKAANVKLKDLKALRDKDVKKAYDAYMEKYTGFVAFAEPYINSAEKALPAVLKCESISSVSVSDVASFKVAIVPCQDALQGAKDISDKDLKTFIASYIGNVDKISAIVDEVGSLSSNDYTKKSALRTQLYDETDKLSDAQKDANSNIEKRLRDVSPRDTYNALGEVLTEKQLK